MHKTAFYHYFFKWMTLKLDLDLHSLFIIHKKKQWECLHFLILLWLLHKKHHITALVSTHKNAVKGKGESLCHPSQTNEWIDI